MFIRASTVRRNGRVYRYAQLVESFRRDDGVPAHRVLHSFGQVDDTLLENLRAAFRGAKDGERLAVAPQPQPQALSSKLVRPRAALRYLDIAVVLELFTQLGLDRLLDELIDDGGRELPARKVVAALVAQRCVAPDSKLAATRWIADTALPELLAIAPEQFNNTRVHRVLAQLDDSTAELMRAITERCAETTGGFTTLYMDITDTWFVGDGPELAARGKTKEGMVRKKVGIVLLCSEQGYPLRWDVLQGCRAEASAMLDMMYQMRHVPWLRGAPVVCDRAMGHSAHLRKMLDVGLKFITAVCTPEMQTYYPRLDELTRTLDEVHVTSEEHLELARELARKRVEAAGMKPGGDTFVILDAGTSVVADDVAPSAQAVTGDAPGDALRAAMEITEMVASGRFVTYADASRAMKLDPRRAKRFRRLLTLPQDVQQRILGGEAAGLPANRFVKLADHKGEQAQREAFETAVLRPPKASASTTESQPSRRPEQPEPRVRNLRVVVSFNPEIFAFQRFQAHRQLQTVQEKLAELNAHIAQPRSTMTAKGIQRRVDDMLRGKDLLQAFNVQIDSVPIDGKHRFQVKLTLDEANWRQRRRTDGFSVLVAHPEVAYGAKRIVETYRAKDTVETDFRVIKSQLHLRPIRHRNDQKVRAHVTLCMLALLVERTLRRHLAKAKAGMTAERALEVLEPVRLCHFAAKHGKDTYLPTELSSEQHRVLRSLKLLRLAEPSQVAAAVTPRAAIVTTSIAKEA